MYGATIQPQATLGLHFAGIRNFPFNFNGVRGIVDRSSLTRWRQRLGEEADRRAV
jgi:hypothetical protein